MANMERPATPVVNHKSEDFAQLDLRRFSSARSEDAALSPDAENIPDDKQSAYWSARSRISSIFGGSGLTATTGKQSQLGATWRSALILQINSGFGSGAPRSENYKGVREGREKGGFLPRIKGVGRTGKAPAKVPKEMQEAFYMQRIEERIEEMRFVKAEEFGKAIQNGMTKAQTLADFPDLVEPQEETAEVVDEEFRRALETVRTTLGNLEHYWMEHSSVAKQNPHESVEATWRLNGEKLGELEERIIAVLTNQRRNRVSVLEAVAEVEYFRTRRREWEQARAESGWAVVT